MMQRAYRQSLEFTKETILQALRRSDFCCDNCGRHKSKTPERYLQAHHKIGIYFFLKYRHEFPDITREMMRSLANCSILCVTCHDKVHELDYIDHQEAIKWYKTVAESILDATAPSQLAMTFMDYLTRV